MIDMWCGVLLTICAIAMIWAIVMTVIDFINETKFIEKHDRAVNELYRLTYIKDINDMRKGLEN